MLIKKRLPLMIIILSTVPLLILSFIVYNFTSVTLINNSKDHIKHMTKLESDVLTSLIDKQKTEVELSAQKGSVIDFLEDRLKHPDKEFLGSNEVLNMSRELSVRAKTLPELEHSFILDLKGNVVADSNIIIKVASVSDRSYYKEALKGNLNIGHTVYSKIDGRTVNVLAAPVKDDNGKIIGVFCNSFYTDYFEKFTAGIKIGNTGYAFLVDDDNIIVAHPDKSKIGEKLSSSKLPVILDQIKKHNIGNIGLTTDLYKNQNRYTGYCFIPDLKWTLVVSQTTREVNGPAMFELYAVIVIFLTMFVFSIIASFVASDSITKPIEILTDTMNRVARGNLGSTCEYKADNEFGQLSNNLNSMVRKLNTSYNELAAVYDDVYEKEEELRSQNSELIKSQEALKRSEERYKQALDGINDVVWELDTETNKFFASDKWHDIYGYKIEETNVSEILRKSLSPKHRRQMFRAVQEHVKKKTPYFRTELKIITGSGEEKWILFRGKSLSGSGKKPTKFTGAITDITERKIAEEKISQLAYYDLLTNLPNRNTFINELHQELVKCAENGNSGAVLFIDLDDFKIVNDSLGHDAGDMLIKEISEKLNGIINKNDILCRFGGDEFLILRKNVRGREDIERLSNIILETFKNSTELSGRQIFTTASIGISMFPSDGIETNIILKNADTAMYRAKARGKNIYQFYNEEMSEGLNREMQIERALRNVNDIGNLYLNYQPFVELKTGKVIGTEALLRLESKEIGAVSPVEFIPIAERTGLIIPIGNWVAKTACEQNKSWIGSSNRSVRVSVNVSSIQIKQTDFVEVITNCIRDTGMPYELFEIEITESVLMESLETNVGILKRLKEFGIRTALDDFGTGYSSLNYLRAIPIDTLKIDKSFIDDICHDKRQEAIVDVIIKMAHEMGVEVVAEGVETKEQLEKLREKSCDIIQGYIFSRPEPSSKISGMFDNYFVA